MCLCMHVPQVSEQLYQLAKTPIEFQLNAWKVLEVYCVTEVFAAATPNCQIA